MAEENKKQTEEAPIETKEEIVKDIEGKNEVPEEVAKAEEKIAEQEAKGEEPKIEEAVKEDIKKNVEKIVKEKTSKKEKEIKPELEREYVIPLREKVRVVPRYKKTNKAVKTVKEFLARHMKIRDRDLNKIKLDTYLNDFLWSRGIRHPPHSVKVKAVKIGELVRVELAEPPKKLVDKKARIEKREKISSEAGQKKGKKKAPEKEEKKSEEDVKAEEEKKSAVVEAGQEMEKTMAKEMKHAARTPQRNSTAQKRSLQR